MQRNIGDEASGTDEGRLLQFLGDGGERRGLFARNVWPGRLKAESVCHDSVTSKKVVVDVAGMVYAGLNSRSASGRKRNMQPRVFIFESLDTATDFSWPPNHPHWTEIMPTSVSSVSRTSVSQQVLASLDVIDPPLYT